MGTGDVITPELEFQASMDTIKSDFNNALEGRRWLTVDELVAILKPLKDMVEKSNDKFPVTHRSMSETPLSEIEVGVGDKAVTVQLVRMGNTTQLSVKFLTQGENPLDREDVYKLIDA